MEKLWNIFRGPVRTLTIAIVLILRQAQNHRAKTI